MNKQYHIELNGEIIPVEEAVYRTYQQANWREKKQKQVSNEKECSYDYMCEIGDEINIDITEPSLEEMFEGILLLEKLVEAIATLNDDERDLIYALFYKGKSEREFAAHTGTSQTTINYRKNKLFQYLRKKLE